MYTVHNFRTKKELIKAFKEGVKIEVFQAGGVFPSPKNGSIALEGPHYPAPHSWYASGVIENDILVKVK